MLHDAKYNVLQPQGTHTAHGGDGDGAGDEAEALVHADVEVGRPAREGGRRGSCSSSMVHINSILKVCCF